MNEKDQNQEMPQWAKSLMEVNQVLLEKVKELEKKGQGQDPEASGAQKVLDKLQENENKKRDEEIERKIYSQIINDLMKD